MAPGRGMTREISSDMNRIGKYIKRALKAYENRDVDDLLIQLSPCIDGVSAKEYGKSSRTSFRDFVAHNLPIASYLGLRTRIEDLNIAVKVDGVFSQNAVSQLRKVAVKPTLPKVPSTMPEYARKLAEKSKLDLTEFHTKREAAGYLTVPFGHILYHCLRCELLHTPNMPESIEFVEEPAMSANDILKIPIHLLYGYIIATVASPSLRGVDFNLEESIYWDGINACTRISWLWGNRPQLAELIQLNESA